MTAEQQKELDIAYQKVVEQRNKDRVMGRYWMGGLCYYIEGSPNAPKNGFFIKRFPNERHT